jgi:hypothetical protein
LSVKTYHDTETVLGIIRLTTIIQLEMKTCGSRGYPITPGNGSPVCYV